MWLVAVPILSNLHYFQEDSSSLEEICMKCWQTLNQFNQFCEKIRTIHQNLIEVTRVPTPGKGMVFEEHTEVFVDDVEETDPLNAIDEDKLALPMLSIESDLGNESPNFERRSKHSSVF